MLKQMVYGLGLYEFPESVEDIVERGTKSKYFRNHVDTYLMIGDKDFLKNRGWKIYGKPITVNYTKGL